MQITFLEYVISAPTTCIDVLVGLFIETGFATLSEVAMYVATTGTSARVKAIGYIAVIDCAPSVANHWPGFSCVLNILFYSGGDHIL